MPLELSADQARLLVMLLPQFDGLVVEQVKDLGASVDILARTRSTAAACHGCGDWSSRVHDRYRRRLQDVACGGRPVRVELEVRRFICGDRGCPVATFAEQVEGVTERHQRRTTRLRTVLERIALALAGNAGSRLARALGVAVSRCTLIRLIRALPDPEVGSVTVLGVDEFAKRRGQSYATILIDLDTHRPIDVLNGREAQPLADWLAAHPGVRVVCRDRAGGFAEGARLGAPDALQCADRWHLFQNLCVVVDKTIRAHRADLREPIPNGEDQHSLQTSGQDTTIVQDETSQTSKAAGEPSHIGPTEDLVPGAKAAAQLHNFIPYLRKRILDDRCTNAALLFQELREHGYQGSARTLRRYLVPFRDELAERELPSVPLAGPAAMPIADRTRQRHAEIHTLLGQGFNQTQICQITGLSEHTVKKFRRAATADELLGDPGNQYRFFEAFVPYLRKRVIEDGCANAALLFKELRDQGYRGSTRTIRRYLVPLRAGLDGPNLPPKPPSVRDVRRWITSDPDHLTDADKDHLAAILDRSQPLAALDQHVTTFAKMLVHRTGERDLDDWLTAVDDETTDLPHLRSFAQGLRRDYAAVLNGLSLPYSSGAVEGENCKVKHLKRIMFGRANLDLLRAMILHN